VPIPPAEDSTVTEDGTLARGIETHLGPKPELKECRRTIYVLANIVFQLSADNPVPLKAIFGTQHPSPFQAEECSDSLRAGEREADAMSGLPALGVR
jgi:hypothetical protein